MPKAHDQNPRPDFAHWIERLKGAGFTAHAEGGGGYRLSKHGCAAVLEFSPSGEPRFSVRPGLLVRAATVREPAKEPRLQDEIAAVAHLVDRGYQKFWQAGERQIPALAAQLQALHRFDQDLRAVMGLTALYNEALGSVSSRYIYDRLEGREKGKRHPPF